MKRIIRGAVNNLVDIRGNECLQTTNSQNVLTIH